MTAYIYGGFWRRAVAIIVDKIIIYILYLILIIFEFLLLPSHPYSHQRDAPPGLTEYLTKGFLLVHIFVFIVMAAAYFTYFHGATGQTPGKMLLNLRVIRVSGQKLTYGRAFLRWIGYGISAFFFYLGYLWVAFDDRKQGWHDKIANTCVIALRRAAPSQVPPQLNIDI